ncbi:hypothetical protein DQ04_00541230 [Trypanosoma grayi]|uniref:hypothetical protein n=1 Tax=Trypanosoma grayi TaxID=71804 RepID=UPI0004F4882C|nr:hypothetical protein DQ04_00541230 [Trypanosoma grayi]KEG14291.1 hypothetical protein DQ04_00541230 [Trypanosoma grayi]
MGASSKENAGAEKVPYSNVVRDARLAAQRHRWRMPKATYMMVPVALLFTVGGFYFTFRWADERAKEGPCIDCKRQQEIMEELYGKRPTVHKGYRV